MTTRVSQQVAEMFSKHELTQIGTDPESYYLHEPGSMDSDGHLVGRSLSTFLVFTKEGIVVMGDLCPRRRGVISDYGYTVDWFSTRMNEEYLCSKFLEQSLHADGFRAWLTGRLEDEEKARTDLVVDDTEPDEEMIAYHERRIELMKRALVDLEDTSIIESVHQSLLVDLGEYGGDSQGYDYDPEEADLLCAIQQRFSALWAERKKKIHDLYPSRCPASSGGFEEEGLVTCIKDVGHKGAHMSESGSRWLAPMNPNAVVA